MEREPRTSGGKNVCAKMIAVGLVTHVTPKTGARSPFTILKIISLVLAPSTIALFAKNTVILSGSDDEQARGEHSRLGGQSGVSSEDPIHRLDQDVAQGGQDEESG